MAEREGGGRTGAGAQAARSGPPEAGVLFLAGFAIAYIGAFVAVAPLLQILAPLRAEAIDPADKAGILGLAVFYGALAAGAANIAAGALSDRTGSRFGRRRPWMIVGAMGTAGAYGLILRADSGAALLGGLVVFQIMFNVMFAPLLAFFADRVPEPRKGVMSAILGMGYPLATMAGAALVGVMIHGEAARFAALAVVVVLAVVPFALLSRDPPARRAAPASARPRAWSPARALGWLKPFTGRDFALAWTGRFLMTTGFSLVSVYLLYYVADAVGYARFFPGRAPEAGLSLLTATAFAGVILVSGGVAVAARRYRRRKPLAALGAACLTLAALVLAGAQQWSTVVGAFALYGCGMGFYFAIELALMTDVLPSAGDRGKDLGLFNLAATLPQAFAPLLGLALLTTLDAGFRGLFAAAAVCFVGAGAAIAMIRAVR